MLKPNKFTVIIHLFISILIFLEYTANIDKNAKIPIRLPPPSSDGLYHERPIIDFDLNQPAVAERRSLNYEMEFLDEDKEVYPLPNVRHRRQNEGEERRLSQSAFNRITETLGALNTVGSFFLNMTRGEQHNRGDMQLISSSSSSMKVENTKKPATTDKNSVFSIDLPTTTQQSMSDAVLTLTKTVLGQNVTKTIEPLIKRVGLSEQPEKDFKLVEQTLNEKIDMAALAEKKRKKHQAINTKNEVIATTPTTLTPGNLQKEIKQWKRKPNGDITLQMILLIETKC